MARDPVTGERTGFTKTPAQPTYATPTRRGTISVPASYVQRKLWERMQAERVALTTGRDVAHRPADDPVQGQVAVMPRDEREAKYGKPLVYLDFTPGQTPILAVGGGAEHWQDLRDQVAETRHYRQDAPVIPRRMDWQRIWNANVDIAQRRAAGKHTYGATTKGLL